MVFLIKVLCVLTRRCELVLAQRFREDTMLLWWSLLLQLRLLFCGQPAHDVGNCCLAAPLLVAPLVGFTPVRMRLSR